MFPGGEDERQIGEAGNQVDDAETGDGAAHEVVGEKRLQPGPQLGEVIALPERRPGKDDEEQADLEKERDVNEPADQNLPPRLYF